ncbi:hypothetical protein SAMN04487944_101569 [Gracilibacillus ureilyticus]|uniref:Uncharacterized protein n=1 Tax=Gracilibacillus ureilyticus TaxID=531814 RepID=A0A1H9M6D1_9BACI|nr:hypothetical protein [Gracilibacillus ureilyticus]SER19029.1 hypothetical protein SAMN04487944_101569 [Gracilibacillus ureilyticus]
MERHLVKSLMMCEGSELKMLYILLVNLPVNLLSGRQEKVDSFINEQMALLAEKNEVKLQVDIFLEMTRICKLKGLDYAEQDNLFLQSRKIVNYTFKEYTKNEKSINTMEIVTVQQKLRELFDLEDIDHAAIQMLADQNVRKRIMANNRLVSKQAARQKLLGVITAILLSKDVPPLREQDIYHFINEWKNRYEEYMNLHQQLIELKTERDGAQNDYDENQRIINDIQKQIRHANQQILLEKKTLQSILKYADLDQLHVNDSFEANRQAYEQIQQKIGKLYRRKHSHSDNKKLWSKINAGLTSVSISVQVKNQERKASYYLSEMVEDLLVSNVAYREAEQKKIKDWEQKIKDLTKWENQHKTYQERLKKELIQWKYQVVHIQKSIKELAKENYGLADLDVPIDEPLLLEE